jgi:hypothetical protein
VSRGSLWRTLAVALPMLAALVAPLPSVDLTFLLRAGSEILGSGAIPSTDTWTFTAAGTTWLDQQWGSEVILQLVYGAAGWTGLVILRAVLVGAAFGLLLVTVRARAPRLGAIGSALLVIAAFIVSADALALRAQLFAIVLFAATLYLLAIRRERPRAVWLIPVLAVVWANVHGTFLFAPALCGLAWFAEVYEAASIERPEPPEAAEAPEAGESREQPVRHPRLAPHEMLLVGVAATAATLVNPFGPAVWGYVASLTSNPTIAARVSEWRPPSPLTVPGALLYVSAVGVALLAIARLRRARRGRNPWPALLTLVLFGGFALASGRGTAWWPFAAVFVIAPWLRPGTVAPSPDPGERRADGSTPAALRRLNLAIVAVLALVGIALLPSWRTSGAAGVPVGTLAFAPQGIAQALNGEVCNAAAGPLATPAAAAPPSRVWNPQVWGSWLEFAAPTCAYVVDSRVELFSSQVWADDETIETGGAGWDEVLRRYQVLAVVTNHATEGSLEAALGQSDRWTRLYDDADGSVWRATRP